jgi:hypothetical protein
MKILTASVAALIAITMTCQAQAAQVLLTSPNQGQTFDAFSSIESRGLHWNARDHMLTAVITYSNKNYESPAAHPHDDTLAFALPGVQYDEASNVFYVMKNGRRVPVAKFTTVFFGKKIQLLPGAAIYAQQNHGDVSVKLIQGEPDPNLHWIDIY